MNSTSGINVLERAFSPFLFCRLSPGASPQAGMVPRLRRFICRMRGGSSRRKRNLRGFIYRMQGGSLRRRRNPYQPGAKPQESMGTGSEGLKARSKAGFKTDSLHESIFMLLGARGVHGKRPLDLSLCEEFFDQMSGFILKCAEFEPAVQPYNSRIGSEPCELSFGVMPAFLFCFLHRLVP